MKEDGLAAMLYDLQIRDISQFEVRDFPQTSALKMQKTLSLNSLERWWLVVLERGYLWRSRHGAQYFQQWQEFYSNDLLRNSYSQWCDENRPHYRKSAEALGKFLNEMYTPKRPGGGYPLYEFVSVDRSGNRPLDDISIMSGDRPHGYSVGPLDAARARFAEKYDIILPWWPEGQ
jgi:hypothetical protein